MAVRLYANVAGGEDLDLFIDPQQFNKTEDEDRLAVVQELQGLSDPTRTYIALLANAADLDAYDDALRDEAWQIQDRLDYYALYSNRIHTLTVRDGAWFSPDLVESFCGESGVNVVGNSIDGDFGTIWRHSVDERHSVVYQLRDWPKKISRIRFRYSSAEPTNEQLSNMDVRAAKNVSVLGEPEAVLESGLDIVWPTGAGNVWVEHTLALKKGDARFIQLDFDTASGNNTGQIREFEVWVETRDP